MTAIAGDMRRTDKELMILLAKGEMEPLGELYVRYGGAVRSLLWRLLPDESMAEVEDLCQEIFETVYETASRFRPESEIRPWIFGITAQRARGLQRKKWMRNLLFKRYVHERMTYAPIVIEAPDSTEISLKQINLAITALPHKQREVLVLHVNQNLSGEQISETLGININTVWTRLRRARLSLHGALQKAAEGEEAGEEQ